MNESYVEEIPSQYMLDDYGNKALGRLPLGYY